MTKQTIHDQTSIEYKTLQQVNELVATMGLDPNAVTFSAINIGEYDSDYNSHISFVRLETDGEYRDRTKKQEQRQQEIEKRERENYERLHKKYGNKG